MKAENKTDSLLRWYKRLKERAKAKGCGFLVTAPEDHKDGFDDGDSPDDELNSLVSDCDDDCLWKRVG